MPDFNGLRVLSFESRRAKEIAQLITKNGGVALIAPSTREVPEGPNPDEQEFARRVIEGSIDSVIFMTGVGARALIEAAVTVCPREQFFSALSRSAVIVRGPKPAAIMREFSIPVALTVPEPNTWREIVKALDDVADTLPLRGRRVAVQEHGEPSLELYDALRSRGAEVFPVRVYHWELPEDTGPMKNAVRALAANEIEVVLFTSSVQYIHAARIAEELGMRDAFLAGLDRALVASIGPTTTQTLRKNGVHVDLEPSHPRMGFLVKETSEKSADLHRK